MTRRADIRVLIAIWLLSIPVVEGACALCPGGKIMRATKTKYVETMDMPPMACGEIEEWLGDAKCVDGRNKFNSSCCDYTPAGVPTFFVAEYNLGRQSRANVWYFHIIHYAAAAGFEEGFLEPYIPNWRDFKIEYWNYGQVPVYGVAEGKAFVNTILPHVMYQDAVDDGTYPNQISAALGGRFSSYSTVPIAGALGIFRVPVVASCDERTLSNKQLYPTFLRLVNGNDVLVRSMNPVYISLNMYRVTMMCPFQDRSVADTWREHYSILSAKAETVVWVFPASKVPSDAAAAYMAVHFDDELKWAKSVGRNEPRIIYTPTVAWFMAWYWSLFDTIGFVGPKYLWTDLESAIVRQSHVDIGGTIDVPQQQVFCVEFYPDNQAECDDSPLWRYDFTQLADKLVGSMGVTNVATGPAFYDDSQGVAWNKMWSEMRPAKVYKHGVLPFPPGTFGENQTAWYRQSEANWGVRMTSDILNYFNYLLQFDTAVWLFVAVGQLVEQGLKQHEIRGDTLYNQLLKVDFEGVSGRVKLAADGTRQGSYLISQSMHFEGDRRIPENNKRVPLDMWFFNVAIYEMSTDAILSAQGVYDPETELWPMVFPDGTSNPPLDTRQPCPAGTEYVDFEYGCAACVPGRYSPVENSQCINCNSGFATAESSTLECSICPSGTNSRDLHFQCSRCQDAESKLQGVCVQCTDGETCDPCDPSDVTALVVPIPFEANQTWEMTTGASECLECVKGTHAASRGTPECSKCIPGTYNNDVGAVACKSCDRAHYAEQLGSMACDRCPGAMTTLETGSDTLLDCLCLAGSYYPCEGKGCKIGNATPTADFCVPCPQGAACVGPDESPQTMILGDRHRAPRLSANRMAIGTNVYKCSASDVAKTLCPGGFLGIDDMCAPDTYGLACAECSPEHHYDGIKCVMCEGSTAAWLALAIVGFVALVVYLTLASFPAEPNGTFTIASIHKKRIRAALNVIVGLGFSLFQFAWIFTKMASVEIAPGLFDVLYSGGNSVFEVDFINTACTFTIESTADAAVAHTVILNIAPLLVILISIVLFVIGSSAAAHDKRKWPNKYDVVSNCMVMFSTFFLIIANSAINVGFATFEHPTGEASLVAYPNLLVTSAPAQAMRGICIVGILLWCVGGLAAVMWATWQLPKRTNDLPFRRCTLALQLKYHPHAPWWFVIVLFQKLFIALSITIFHQSTWQGVFVSAVYITYLSLFISFRPTFAPVCFYCEVFSTIGIMTLFLVVWGTVPADGGEGFQFVIVFATYFQFLLFLVIGLIAMVQHEFMGKPSNVAALWKDIGGGVNARCGFGDLRTLEQFHAGEEEPGKGNTAGGAGDWNNATV